MDMHSDTSELADLVDAAMTEAMDAARGQYDNALSAIRRNPVQSMGIAAGIGFILALTTRRRPRPHPCRA